MGTSSKQKAKPKRRRMNIRRYINWKWIVTITVLSFCMSVTMSYLSSESLNNVGNLPAFLILFAFIFLGIIFDMIGIAATSATEKELHSMAARRVKGAKQAVWLCKNAEKVASFCNDVVGDISGIISGATGAVITARITSGMGAAPTMLVTLAITGMVAALTIGGKAMFKAIGMSCSIQIIHAAGCVLALLPLDFDRH